MSKLSSRTQIADADISENLILHLVKLGAPNTSWKGDLNQVIPNYGANVLHVSKDGNDDIAAVFPRYPFQTIAAMETYRAATFTGGNSPSATNRVLVIIPGGFWTEGIVLKDYTDFYLGNSVFQVSSGSLATIDDNNSAINSIIYGNATIKRVAGGSNTNAVRLQNSDSNITIHANLISSSSSRSFYSQDVSGGGTGVINIYSDITNTGSSEGVRIVSGTINVYGNISCGSGGAFVNAGGTLNIYGNCSGTSIGGSTGTGAGTTNVYGIITASTGVGVNCTDSGNLTVHGDIIGFTFGMTCANTLSGIVRVVGGRIQATDNGTPRNAISKETGTLIIDNCTLLSTGGADSITAGTAGRIVKIYGACQANNSVNANITQQVGLLTIDSNVI